MRVLRRCSSASASRCGTTRSSCATTKRRRRVLAGLARVPRAPRRRADRHAARGIGRGVEVHDMDDALIEQSIALAQGAGEQLRRCKLDGSFPATSISPTAPTSTPARAGTRCARASSAPAARSRRRSRPTRRSGVGLRLSAIAAAGAERARRARRAARAARAARLLRLHDQRLSLRPVSRDARSRRTSTSPTGARRSG